MTQARFDELLRRLSDADARFVLVGGMDRAARLEVLTVLSRMAIDVAVVDGITVIGHGSVEGFDRGWAGNVPYMAVIGPPSRGPRDRALRDTRQSRRDRIARM